ncbi:BREX protein BrxB domain-containing protein [Rufibacter psychrotolerans]|uniref:BREX protein BrxB domain-containing protein n=1 Tax=Rufibacter psychrotolerans TaxID=2812556 RepID=UPI001967EF94|nr:BREX protein BrxB domain-containing protein [Rufibacter sp. SYSU D00308]
MTITELYEQLADKNFQDPTTGNLFFPAYMYMYDPEQEYQLHEEIQNIRDRLYRPNSYLNVMVLDIFQEFLNFLKANNFGKKTKFEFFLDQETIKPDKVEESLKRDANSDKFFFDLHTKIQEHFSKSGDYEVGYVFVHGFGAIFPYLRASKFLNNFEKYISGYKIIMFYPGEAKEHYSLFKLLNDENLYRAIKLLN